MSDLGLNMDYSYGFPMTPEAVRVLRAQPADVQQELLRRLERETARVLAAIDIEKLRAQPPDA